MMAIIVFISMLSGAFFFIFKKYGAAIAVKGGAGAGKKPAPVPAYYGRL